MRTGFMLAQYAVLFPPTFDRAPPLFFPRIFLCLLPKCHVAQETAMVPSPQQPSPSVLRTVQYHLVSRLFPVLYVLCVPNLPLPSPMVHGVRIMTIVANL